MDIRDALYYVAMYEGLSILLNEGVIDLLRGCGAPDNEIKNYIKIVTSNTGWNTDWSNIEDYNLNVLFRKLIEDTRIKEKSVHEIVNILFEIFSSPNVSDIKGMKFVLLKDNSVEYELAKNYLDDTCVIIPENIIVDDCLCKVTSIGPRAFEWCEFLTSIKIPNSVSKIGAYAFLRCSSLKSVVIPSSVTNIEEGTFEYCPSLKSVVIPSSVTSIGPRAFLRCSSLKSVVIPSSVTNVGNKAFEGCASITNIKTSFGLKISGVDDFIIEHY